MRRARVIVVALLVALAGVAIGVGAYHAGLTNGLTQAGHAERVVRVVGPGYGFPFGLLLFPLFLLAFFALARTARWGRRWDGPGGGPHGRFGPGGPWGDDRRAMLEDWHRRQHEEGGQGRPETSGDPAHV
jgi:hypothetical protein